MKPDIELNLPTKEFINLLNNSSISIHKIEWWLLKYSADYKATYDYVSGLHWYTFDDGTKARLPLCLEPTADDIFINLYEQLDKISAYCRKENDIKEVLSEYHKVKHSQTALKIWVKKYEELGNGWYFSFLLNFLGYFNEEKMTEHPDVSLLSFPELKIPIDKKYFNYTIKFAVLFHELFFIQRILPESLEKK